MSSPKPQPHSSRNQVRRPPGIFLFGAFGLMLVFATASFARDLWVDHNPYDASVRLAEGAVMKLAIDEPFVVEYEYLNQGSDEVKLKMTPDKGTTDFLPAASSDKTVGSHGEARTRGRVRVQLKLGVTVTKIQGDTIAFTGTKILAPEEGRSQFQLQAAGSIDRRDISGDRQIKSQDVASLQVIMKGGPVARSLGLPIKKDDKGNPSAALTPAEKEQILMDYLNRILGEMKDK